MIKPKMLKKGDTIGIVSPSSGLWKRSELWRGIEELESWGYNVRVGENTYKNRNYLAGHDSDRAEDIMNYFSDNTVDAIFCSQGGYGAGRLLQYLDYEIIKSNPKIFIGYSDITSIHLAINKKSNLVTFHGPNVTSFAPDFLTDYRYEYMMKALCRKEPIGEIKLSNADKFVLKVVKGKSEAPIVGGNLTLVCSSLGTPYEIETKDKIIFLEEIDTEPWIMDHMFTHLLNAGKLQESAGIVIGECKGCEPYRHNPGFFNQCSLEDIIFDLLSSLGVPVIYGLPIGHTNDLATLPIGVMGELDGNNGTFSIIESGTV